MNKTNLTTSNGAPVADDQTSISAGERGPLTFDNWRLFEKLAHFNRERIPERVVHARGSGAYGTFTLTKDLSEYTIAKFLQGTNKKTDLIVRFSTVGGGQDSSDYARDPRGFAIKFYTEEGNFDLVGNNTPVFFLRDPSKFPDFIHSQKKNPQTNIADPAAMFEFWANSPQSLHQITILMSDRGIPYSYRHMNGYGSHTLSFWNSKGKRFWVKWHFKTNQGIKCLTDAETCGLPSHGAQLDLFESIEKGDYPSWAVKLQIADDDEIKKLNINPFDLTKVWPHNIIPLVDIGSFELNRNVDNYFAEVEQAAFSPSNFVPGISASPDKMLQARLLAYPDAHRYRVGANVNQLPVNSPRCPATSYQRDGFMAGVCPAHGNSNFQNNIPNFYPNDGVNEGTAAPVSHVVEPELAIGNVNVGYFNNEHEDNFSQAGDLYRLMSEDQKNQLTNNIAGGLKQAKQNVIDRMLAQFEKADPDYCKRIKALIEK